MEKTILQILASNARLTNQQIADMTGFNVTDIDVTIENLQKNGIIKGFKAIVDWEAADIEICEARIELCVTPKADKGFEEIANRVAQFEEVQSVYLISGGYDLAVSVVGKDFKEVASFVSQKLSTLDSVQATATHFVLKKYKETNTDMEQEQDIREVLL